MADFIEPWLYGDEPFTDDKIENNHCGFIYIITNISNNRKYIGKKIFTNTTRVKVKNKTRRKIKKKQSNWETYYGSSPALNADIEIFGKSNFKREIIKLCISKSELTYFEAKEQFLRGCLESPEWYNEHIMCRVRKANLKFASLIV